MLEEFLLKSAQSGNKEALEQLIQKYYDPIYTYCFHHTNDRQTAEDICQDTFCSMLEHMGEYRHYHKFLNYLYVIAGNKCKDFYKKKKPVCLSELPEEMQENQLENSVAIKQLVQGLPSELREVIILRFYQELKYQDIARILQISNSLVKYRVKKALSCLQEELERGGK